MPVLANVQRTFDEASCLGNQGQGESDKKAGVNWVFWLVRWVWSLLVCMLPR